MGLVSSSHCASDAFMLPVRVLSNSSIFWDLGGFGLHIGVIWTVVPLLHIIMLVSNASTCVVPGEAVWGCCRGVPVQVHAPVSTDGQLWALCFVLESFAL